MTAKTDIKSLFGLPPTSQKVEEFISSLSLLANAGNDDKTQIKAYTDAVFVNYYALGCSIEYRPTNGYKPPSNVQFIAELQTSNLALDKIDTYNSPHDEPNTAVPPASQKTKSKTTPVFAKYPCLPIVITFSHEPKSMSVSLESTGKDFIAALGEPDRKGGGAGPSSGSIDIWCEWTKEGVMVEFGGRNARGPQAWDKGKDAKWKVISFYPALPHIPPPPPPQSSHP
ncbi:hypothetical protein BDM02DRAFT_3112683 [Thelephora ganbajun]|uniref:Uncharacterized protein n=1 Tax=Thelephora ganbajun TaxID=370292 RepID=A0ACB6ZL09_THEGA|nr:hypothetical protein BDM02DRAFT_3112683 [Thelephora ganbajun]